MPDLGEWFTEVAKVQNPGSNELVGFLTAFDEFMQFVLENSVSIIISNKLPKKYTRPDLRSDEFNFSFLWEDDLELGELAYICYQKDIRGSLEEVKKSIASPPPLLLEEAIRYHGLSGRPLQFKLRAIDAIANKITKIRKIKKRSGFLSMLRKWLKQLLEAIDVLLGSVKDALANIPVIGGILGAVEEFKQALEALINVGEKIADEH